MHQNTYDLIANEYAQSQKRSGMTSSRLTLTWSYPTFWQLLVMWQASRCSMPGAVKASSPDFWRIVARTLWR